MEIPTFMVASSPEDSVKKVSEYLEENDVEELILRFASPLENKNNLLPGIGRSIRVSDFSPSAIRDVAEKVISSGEDNYIRYLEKEYGITDPRRPYIIIQEYIPWDKCNGFHIMSHNSIYDGEINYVHAIITLPERSVIRITQKTGDYKIEHSVYLEIDGKKDRSLIKEKINDEYITRIENALKTVHELIMLIKRELGINQVELEFSHVEEKLFALQMREVNAIRPQKRPLKRMVQGPIYDMLKPTIFRGSTTFTTNNVLVFPYETNRHTGLLALYLLNMMMKRNNSNYMLLTYNLSLGKESETSHRFIPLISQAKGILMLYFDDSPLIPHPFALHGHLDRYIWEEEKAKMYGSAEALSSALEDDVDLNTFFYSNLSHLVVPTRNMVCVLLDSWEKEKIFLPPEIQEKKIAEQLFSEIKIQRIRIYVLKKNLTIVADEANELLGRNTNSGLYLD